MVTAAGFIALAALVTASHSETSLDRMLGRVAALPTAAQVASAAVARAESARASTVVAVVAAAVVWRRTAKLLMPAVLVGSWAGTAALVYILDVAFGRTRPIGSAVLGAPSVQGCFPSGHTATTTVLVGLLATMTAFTTRSALARTLILTGGVFLATVLGIGALAADRVRPTDVLGGWLLGTTVVLAVTTVLGSWLAAAGTGARTVSSDDAADPPPRESAAAGTGEPGAAGTRRRTLRRPGSGRRRRPVWKRP